MEEELVEYGQRTEEERRELLAAFVRGRRVRKVMHSSRILALRKELLAMVNSLEEKRAKQDSAATKARYAKKYTSHMETLVRKKKEQFAKKVHEAL